jgi:N-acetylglucosaminyl-diphospho-decaprenol L-rhamnosyltransferase
MSISRQNLSIVIVTLRSEKVIDKCVESINSDLPIIIVENSDNIAFKKYVEEKYKNVECILTNKNLGMGAGNNVGIKASNTDYVYIINPDTTIEKNTLDEIFITSREIEDFTILSPISSDINFPNYQLLNSKNIKEKSGKAFKVDYVDGYSILLNKKKFLNRNYFDENFFMYLENNDLCKRVINHGGSIYIIPKAKINHLGASTVDPKYFNEVELSRNWHWMWSTFYYNKKYKGFFISFFIVLPKFINTIAKVAFFTLVFNKTKKRIYYQRFSGLLNSIIGRRSWYRPKI